MLTRLRLTSQREHGAVMIIVAVALPVIAIMVSLAINVAHWYDYSRNLQLRADAAALAAGDSYGAVCANPTANAMAAIGKTAQLYSGPLSAASDVFYPYGTTPTDLAALGQKINGAAGSNGYYNVPNLKAGTAGHYHMILNSPRYWHPGDTSQSLSFTMPGGTVCNSSDGTDSGPIGNDVPPARRHKTASAVHAVPRLHVDPQRPCTRRGAGHRDLEQPETDRRARSGRHAVPHCDLHADRRRPGDVVRTHAR